MKIVAIGKFVRMEVDLTAPAGHAYSEAVADWLSRVVDEAEKPLVAVGIAPLIFHPAETRPVG